MIADFQRYEYLGDFQDTRELDCPKNMALVHKLMTRAVLAKNSGGNLSPSLSHDDLHSIQLPNEFEVVSLFQEQQLSNAAVYSLLTKTQ